MRRKVHGNTFKCRFRISNKTQLSRVHVDTYLLDLLGLLVLPFPDRFGLLVFFWRLGLPDLDCERFGLEVFDGEDVLFSSFPLSLSTDDCLLHPLTESTELCLFSSPLATFSSELCRLGASLLAFSTELCCLGLAPPHSLLLLLSTELCLFGVPTSVAEEFSPPLTLLAFVLLSSVLSLLPMVCFLKQSLLESSDLASVRTDLLGLEPWELKLSLRLLSSRFNLVLALSLSNGGLAASEL